MKTVRADFRAYAVLILVAQLLVGAAVILVATHSDSTPAAREEHAQPQDRTDARY